MLGDAQSKADDPLKPRMRSPARFYGFYPSPDDVVKAVMAHVDIFQDKNKPPLRILEPSAGTGQLARACLAKPKTDDRWWMERYGDEYRYDNKVDCVEIQGHMARELDKTGLFNKVICADFIAVSPEETGLYDYVVMNPPFDRERDIDHVMHALEFLKPGGTLVAVMSAGTEFRSTKKSEAFRTLMDEMGATWKDLPAGSFASVGTYCNTGILCVRKGAKKDRWSRPTWPEIG